MGKQAAKIHVGGDNHPVLVESSGKHFGIWRSLPPNLPKMNNIVTCVPQAFGQFRRKCVIDKESQDYLIIGSSRSRTASAA